MKNWRDVSSPLKTPAWSFGWNGKIISISLVPQLVGPRSHNPLPFYPFKPQSITLFLLSWFLSCLRKVLLYFTKPRLRKQIAVGLWALNLVQFLKISYLNIACRSGGVTFQERVLVCLLSGLVLEMRKTLFLFTEVTKAKLHYCQIDLVLMCFSFNFWILFVLFSPSSPPDFLHPQVSYNSLEFSTVSVYWTKCYSSHSSSN